MSDYTKWNGTIRRKEPRVRMSKKERIKKRWEGKEQERFAGQRITGRGNVAIDQINKVKEYMRANKDGVTAVEIALYVNCSQARAARLLDLLSGVCKDGKDDEAVFDSDDFLIYSDEDINPPLYYIYQDNGR